MTATVIHKDGNMRPTAPAASPYTDVHETHAGVVFLVGDRAYKLKKPEDFGFLDFSTRELRLAACRREVELNSRLAPDVYEGVFDVLGPDGHPVDHLVAMRRMPDERRLSTLVRTGAQVDGELHRIAHLLAAFHTRAQRGPQIREQGSAEALRGRWTDSFAQTRPFKGTVLGEETTEIERSALRFIDGRRRLFADRAEEGRIIDGHGDLLADDIFCLDDGPRILDCLEFDDHLRWLDGLDDAAFLAMDLERLGAPALGAAFLRAYTSLIGDPAPPSLRHHYIAYRAFVRAKVACLRHAQGDDTAGPQARLLERITLDHLRRGTVRLVLIGGPPATGKTTIAGGLADRLGTVLISSDRLRKEHHGLAPHSSAAAPYGEGIYDAPTTHRVYEDMLRRARELLARGESVVLDASWSDRNRRHAAAELAVEARADLTQLCCGAPDDVLARRLAERPGAGGISDADAVIAQRMAEAFQPWPEAAFLDTSRPVHEVLAQAVAAVDPSARDAAAAPSGPTAAR